MKPCEDDSFVAGETAKPASSSSRRRSKRRRRRKRKFQNVSNGSASKRARVIDESQFIVIDQTGTEARPFVAIETAEPDPLRQDCLFTKTDRSKKMRLSSDKNVRFTNSDRFPRSEMGMCAGVIMREKSLSVSQPSCEESSFHSSSNTGHFNQCKSSDKEETRLRPIIVDGSNVAFGHGKDKFSCLGLKICVDHFRRAGHTVRAFVPQYRRRHPSTRDSQLLDELEKQGIMVYTPSRSVHGRMVVPYDDRFIVEYAHKIGGIIVTRDNFRDLLRENPEWEPTIANRLLMFTWVDDMIMFPHDPLGRGGPTLEQFLKF